jgi:hypothetical protein
MHAFTRRRILLSGITATAATLIPKAAPQSLTQQPPPESPRAQWLAWLDQVSRPVLEALAANNLRRTMPVEAVSGHQSERAVGTHLEAFARLLAGIAPWLELDPTPSESPSETTLRTRYRTLARQSLANALDPASPDHMAFGASGQTLVDSSFLSLALLRAPRQLIATLSPTTRTRLIAALVAERTIQPPFNNWLLFAALNEALLRRLDAPWDRLRIDYALREHQSWYLGDATYGDGPHFHADFYNSYVIHPYLLALMDEVRTDSAFTALAAPILARARRYAAIQERVISPTGEFPVLGRSITYRAGAFHLLADIALRHELPETLNTAAVRSALTAVQLRTLTPPGTFDSKGWLQIGLAGHQPSLAETYISTGSLYLASAVWLPLGLAPADPFWQSPAADWTQKAIWSGKDAPADHALDS